MPKTAPAPRHLAADDDMPPAEPAGEPDGDEPKGPAFAEGDAVIYADRPANVVAVKNGPHYALEFTDEDGGEFAYATESDLASASASDGAEDEPGAEDEQDPQASVIRRQAAQIRALQAKLAGKAAVSAKGRVDALLATAKADRKITPAMEAPLRTLATRGFEHVAALVAAMPRIMPVAVKQPARKEPFSPPLTHNGKSWGEMSVDEKHAVFLSDRDLAEKMHKAHETAKAAAASVAS